jgi:xanthine dehydrogenase YagS FAD-binding subunit
MRNFQYGKPASLEQAAAFLAKGDPGVFLMGGGTDLLGEIKEGLVAPAVVVDLQAVPGLAYIRKDKDGLAIGALTTITEIAEDAGIEKDYRVLHEAARAVASPQLRNMGTVGGNLCQRPRCWYYRDAHVACNKKGGAKCYAEKGRNKYHALFAGGLCYAVHPSDLAPALIALDGKAVLASAKGERTVPLAEFFTPPIVNVRRENVLNGQEIVKEIRLPAARPKDKSSYLKFIERGSWDFAVVSAAVKAVLSGTAIEDIRIVCGGVAPVPWRMRKAEDALKGRKATEAAARQAAKIALKDAAPLAENGYKVDLLETIISRAVAALAR